MVCLNKNISFNVKSLRNKLTLEMKSFIDDYDHLLKDEKYVLSLKNNIEKKIKELFWDNHFIYLTMNNDMCSFKHKRGKNEGFICSKLIKTNIEDNKKDYLCCTHSKKHIPKKRKIIKDLEVSEIKKTIEPVIFDNKEIISDKSRNRNIILENKFEKVENVGKVENKLVSKKMEMNDKNIIFNNKLLLKSNIKRNNFKVLKTYNKNINNIDLYKKRVYNDKGYKSLIKEIKLSDFIINKNINFNYSFFNMKYN